MLAPVLFSFLGASAGQDRLLPTVPAYFWSGMPIFNGAVVTDYVPSSSVWETLETLTGLRRDGTNPLVTEVSEKPEVVLAFTYDKLDADLLTRDPELSRFKPSLDTATSSLAVPYVLSDGVRATALSHHACCCSEAENYLRSSGVLHDGVSDLVVVDVDGSEAHDELVNSIMAMVNEETEGRYVALLTANKTAPSDLVLEFAPKDGVSNRRRLSYADSQKRQIPLTPGILSGLLVGGLLLIIFLSGFCCLFNLQTPRKFEHE